MPRFSAAGPWALVILLSSFLMKAIVYGITFSIGLYTVEFLKYFDTSATKVSLVASINMGVYRLAGPFVSLLLKKFSYRTVAIGGGILAFVGTLTVVFERDIPSLCVSYGLIAGFGFCTCFLISSALVGVYFKKYRAIATAISESGAPFGICVMPLIITKIIDEYTWRGSFYIISCLTSQLIVLGALFRPPPRFQSSTQADVKTQYEIKENHHVEEIAKWKPSTRENNEQVSPVFTVLQHNENSLLVCEDKTGGYTEPYLPLGKTSDDLNTTREASHFQPRPGNAQIQSKETQGLKQFTKAYFKVLGNLGFMLFTLSWTLFGFSISAFMSFIPQFIISIGLTADDAAQLIVILSVSCFVISIMSGLLYNSPYVNIIVLYVIGNIGLGVSCLLCNYLQSYYNILTIFIFCGAANALIISGRVIIIIDCVGTDCVADALGFNSLASGLGFFAGPPLAGYLYDATNNFDAMFYCLFAVQCLASLIMVFYLIQQNCSSRRWTVNKK